MQEKYKNILDEGDKEINPDELLQYLNGGLNSDELHKLEQKLLNNDFENDALEGLSKIEKKKKLKRTINKLDRTLNRELSKKFSVANFYLKNNLWLYISLVIFLVLIVLCYLILWKMQ